MIICKATLLYKYVDQKGKKTNRFTLYYFNSYLFSFYILLSYIVFILTLYFHSA